MNRGESTIYQIKASYKSPTVMIRSSLVHGNRVSWPWAVTLFLCWTTMGGLCSYTSVQQMKCRFKPLFSHLAAKSKAWNKSRAICCLICNLTASSATCWSGHGPGCWLGMFWQPGCAQTYLYLCVNVCECATCLVFIQRLCALEDTPAPCHSTRSMLALWLLVVIVRVSALIEILLTEDNLVWVMDLIAIWSLERTAWSICYILLDFWKVRSDFLQAWGRKNVIEEKQSVFVVKTECRIFSSNT